MRLYGEKLKEIRVKTGISVKYILTQLNISRMTYWNWEKGVATPSEKRIKELAKVLNVSVSIISDLTGKQFSDKSLDRVLENISAKHNKTDYDVNTFTSIQDSLNMLQKKHIYNSAIIEILLNSINSMFYVKNLDLSYILANDLFIKSITASTKTQYIKKTDKDFFPLAEASENTLEDNNVLITGKPVINREGYIPGTRKKKIGLISKFPIMDENSKIMGVVATIVDITERKNSENRRMILEKIVHKIDEAIWFWEFNSTNRDNFFINAAVEKITGIKAEEFYKDPYVPLKYCHPDFKNDLKDFYNKKERPAQIEYKLIRPTDKAEAWIRQVSYQEENLKYGIAYDITEDKKNEHIKDLLKLYVELAKPGILIIDIDTGNPIYINNSRSVIYGRSIEEMMNGGYIFWLNHCVYGKDKEFYEQFKSVDSFFSFSLSDRTGKYKIIRPDGQVRSILCEASFVNYKGKQCALFVEHDITEENLCKN